MDLQRILLLERRATNLAGNLLIFRMSLHVSFQPALEGEPRRAHRADVVLLAAVPQQMPLQVLSAGVALVADAAPVRVRGAVLVEDHVLLEFVRLHELFLADLALVGLKVLVPQEVVDEVVADAELFVAVNALVGGVFDVLPRVPHETRDFRVNFVAKPAGDLAVVAELVAVAFDVAHALFVLIDLRQADDAGEHMAWRVVDRRQLEVI